MSLIEAHGVLDDAGDGPVVVLGHGIGGGPHQWDGVVDRLRGRARIITFSLAGSPAADPDVFDPSRHASILGFAEDLAMICGELGLREAVYIGHSMSGMAGALASVGDPGLFSRLVMLNASPCYVDHDDYVGGFTAVQVEQLLTDMSANYSMWAAGFGAHVMGNPDHPELALEFVRTLSALEPEVAAVTFRAAFTSDFRQYVARVPVPTLVVQSLSDPAVPLAAARWLADTIPDGRLVELTASGHFPHVVDAAEVTRAVADFVLASA